MLSCRKPPSAINRSISSRRHWSATNLAIDVFSWPDSEVAECRDDFRFLGYSGLVVLMRALPCLTEADIRVEPEICHQNLKAY
jgi:hypothetical protein